MSRPLPPQQAFICFEMKEFKTALNIQKITDITKTDGLLKINASNSRYVKYVMINTLHNKKFTFLQKPSL